MNLIRRAYLLAENLDAIVGRAKNHWNLVTRQYSTMKKAAASVAVQMKMNVRRFGGNADRACIEGFVR